MESLLKQAIEDLQVVPGVAAVVLAGSHASGLAGPDSDLDVGIYYRETEPFDTEAIRHVAARLGENPLVTEPYGWGPWVNGGAWIETTTVRVDFIYRNIEQVERVLEEGRRGVWRHDYDQQPPFGFRSVIYFAETEQCKSCYDPEGVIARLKQLVTPYPAALRRTIVAESLWGAEFSLMIGSKAKDDYNRTGCAVRTAQYLVQALYAWNERYFIGDKHVVRQAATFERSPAGFVERLETGMSDLERMRELWTEMVALTGGEYRPRFDLAIIK